MSKVVTGYENVMVKRPSGWYYTCDTCGYKFKKGERKVTYYSSGDTLYGCKDKPCTPFSNPKDYEWEFNIDKQEYEWVKITKPKP